MATPKDLLHSLSRAYALLSERPSGDPEFVQALEAVRVAHHELGWVVMRAGPDGMTVGAEVVGGEDGELNSFHSALTEAGIREVRLQAELSPRLLEDFLRRIQEAWTPEHGPVSARFRGLESHLGLSFVGSRQELPGMSGSIQGLFRGGRGAEDSGPGSLDDPSPEGLSGTSKVLEREAPADPPTDEIRSQAGGRSEPTARIDFRELPVDLEDDLRSFAAASGSARADLGDQVRDQATQLLATRNVAVLGEMVGLLVELADGSQDSPEVLALARELSTPAVASHLVARLAATREEGEKEHLTGIIAQLGGEVGLALADALREARDRYQRRTLVDAMVALGPTAGDLAAGMLEDSRWYVVRNGVSLLGEVGGEGAVAHLTGTLANLDPRVRKEAVWALAKLGGEDSSMLLLGMLEDGDVEVRSMAARSLGILRIEKAVRPLLQLLEKEEEEDVLIECLRALGQIGDPGAVPQIEKRAVGGIFSRPSQEIRIAAYRALGGIGTPHAMGLLEKATGDSDSAVRAVVQTMLDRRKLLSATEGEGEAPSS